MKKFVAGLIVGMLILGGATFASGEITAMFTSFNFLVDGETKTLESQPLVYNGTSYLPVREVATLLGYDVEYQADSRTIEFTYTTTVPKTPISASEKAITVDMEEIPAYSSEDTFTVGDFKISNIQLEYTNEFEGSHASRGDIFAIISFEVYTESVPNDGYWLTHRLVQSVTRSNGHSNVSGMFTKGESAKIFPNENNNAKVAIRIPENQRIVSVLFGNLLTGVAEAKVILNQ